MKLGLGLGLGTNASASFNPVSLFATSQGALLDPTDASTLFQDAGGATPAGDTQPVGRINDKSGNGRNATQGTAGFRPVRDGLSLSFDGADDVLALPAALLSGWTSGTLIWAAKANADIPSGPANVGPIFGDFGTSGSGDHWPWSDGNCYVGALSTTRSNAGNPGDMAQWHVGEVISAANNYKVGFNGSYFFTSGTNTVGAGATPNIGANASAFFQGRIGRMIAINRVLAGDELLNARRWVASPYGVSV